VITLFWDIDLTLLTTGRAGLLAFEDALEEVCGCRGDLSGVRSAGMTDTGVAELVLATAGVEATPGRIDALLRTYERRLPASLHRRRGHALPNVREVLEDLEPREDVRSLLLTGNTPAGAAAKLAHYDLDRFFPGGRGAFCAGSGSRAEIARRALPLAEGAAHVYVIGDTPDDVACGKTIDARTIAVATGTHSAAELAACEPWVVLEQIPEPPTFRELIGLPGDDGAS
jgi:phosphoglycolate phosphatase